MHCMIIYSPHIQQELLLQILWYIIKCKLEKDRVHIYD